MGGEPTILWRNVDEALVRLKIAKRRESGEKADDFSGSSRAAAADLLSEQRAHWRAELQPREKYGYLYLEDISNVEEAGDVDTRWQAILSLTDEAERRYYYALPLPEEIPRIVTGVRAQNQVAAQNARAAAAGNETGLTAEQWENIVADYGATCAYCGKRKRIVLEHVIPVSRGGGTIADNVLPACLSCNTSKSDRDPVEWLASDPDRLLQFIDSVCKAEGLLVA